VDVATVERFLAVAKKKADPLLPGLTVPAHLGTRREETLALRWSDFDFERKSVTIRRAVVHTKEDGTIVKSTKTTKGRTIPLDADMLDEFKAQMKAQRERRIAYGRGWRGASSANDDYVCAAHDGAVMTPDTYSYAVRCFANDNGFAHITPQVLRHAWANRADTPENTHGNAPKCVPAGHTLWRRRVRIEHTREALHPPRRF
jgi:integrase